MSEVTVFYLISSKFFVDLFFIFGNLIFFSHIANKNPPAYYLFDFLDLITDFLDFLDLKLFFRPKKFLDIRNFFILFRPKNFLNRFKTLKKHLFSLQIDEKNNIFNFRLYSKKLPIL